MNVLTTIYQPIYIPTESGSDWIMNTSPAPLLLVLSLIIGLFGLIIMDEFSFVGISVLFVTAIAGTFIFNKTFEPTNWNVTYPDGTKHKAVNMFSDYSKYEAPNGTIIQIPQGAEIKEIN